MYRLILILAWALLSLFIKVQGQAVKVLIEPFSQLQRVTFTAIGTETWVTVNDSFPETILTLSPGQQVQLTLIGSRVRLSQGSKSLGDWPSLLFWTADSTGGFKLGQEPAKNTKHYFGHLQIQVARQKLKLVNLLWMEQYVKGVVAAEGGIYKTPEFLKVQAICSRTYAVRNLGKYAKEGFDLNDKVDCQVYKGVPQASSLIDQAVAQTQGLILTDPYGEVIDAVFSANCGGQSANSEDVWSSPSAYLRSTPSYDQYREFRNSEWSYNLSRLDFLRILSGYYHFPVYEYTIIPDISGRVKELQLNGDSRWVISGTEIRQLLKLKSTRFRIREFENQCFISGQGFGHGVGMCQDGAYKLSTLGWSHEEILRHFYAGVKLITIDSFLSNQRTNFHMAAE